MKLSPAKASPADLKMTKTAVPALQRAIGRRGRNFRPWENPEGQAMCYGGWVLEVQGPAPHEVVHEGEVFLGLVGLDVCVYYQESEGTAVM